MRIWMMVMKMSLGFVVLRVCLLRGRVEIYKMVCKSFVGLYICVVVLCFLLRFGVVRIGVIIFFYGVLIRVR